MSKRGEGSTSAGSIAVLIILIALFVVFYILMLPPAEREALLNESYDETSQGKTPVKYDIYLLEPKIPGLLKPFESDVVKHELNPVILYIKDEPIITDLTNSLYVSKNLFVDRSHDLTFTVEDLDNVDKINLFFLSRSGDGNLIIELNGEEVFYGVPRASESVTLSPDLLIKQNNLKFKVSSPGIAFWGTNEYRLGDIKVKENYELENTMEERSFVLTNSEEKDEAELNYYIFCNNPIKSSNSKLKIFLNDKEISSELIGCVSTTKTLAINSKDLKDGVNKLIFEIDSGDFLINDIVLKTKAKEGGGIDYKFTASKSQYEDVLIEKKDAILKIGFIGNDLKRCTISINNNEFSLETSAESYSKSISNYIKEGNNIIKIIPDNEFEITDLEIKLE